MNKKEQKRAFKRNVKANIKELNADEAKLQRSIHRIKQMPDYQKKKALKAIEKLPKSLQEAAKKLFE